ncbi:hypothetical protein CLU97_0048 [Chryseobacterium sp. 7]|nr:hypothetical protein CLU97_0048 [Chryseobacterium sp. 7]
MNNKKYYFYDACQSVQISEDELIGKTMDELNSFFTNYQIIKLHTTECIFILKKYFFGMFSLKLHVYIYEDVVFNYTIRY